MSKVLPSNPQLLIPRQSGDGEVEGFVARRAVVRDRGEDRPLMGCPVAEEQLELPLFRRVREEAR